MKKISKREEEKKEKIKKENIEKFDEEYKKSRIIPNDYKKSILIRILKNTIIAIIAVTYLILLNMLSLKLETNIYMIFCKSICIVFAVVSVIYFEISYRKDNGYIFMHGTEFLILATITLFSIYAYTIFFGKYNHILLVICISIVIYYIIKTVVTIINMRKQYYKSQNDIKEIVKK